MPGPPAEDTVRMVKELGCTGKIMLMTGAAYDERIQGLVEGFGIEYISKPFSPRSLKAKVEEAVISHRQG